MKNLLSIALLLTITTAFADEGVKQYLGKWNYTDYLVTLSTEKKDKVNEFFRDFYLEFNEDMTYTGKVMGKDETGTWELEKGTTTITITDAEGNARKINVVRMEGEEMTIDLGYGEFVMTREKKKK